MGFKGGASHTLEFSVKTEESMELEVGLVFPAGGVTTQRKLVKASVETQSVSFNLGPLLTRAPPL